jgi:hypothetical protein
MSQSDQKLPQGWKIWSAESEQESTPNTASDPRWVRELDQIAGTGPKKNCSMPLKMLVPLLITAQRQNSSWLQDFADDVVEIDADLHEVLLAYQKLQNEPKTGQDFSGRQNAAA